MPYINSIGTANAPFAHSQKEILDFMLEMYQVPQEDIEKIKRLYDRSEIETRYSAIEDFSLPKSKWEFIEKDKKTSIESRMKKYFEIAPSLCEKAVRKCIPIESELSTITHLITVSCTGISALGLDIQLMQLLDQSVENELANNIIMSLIDGDKDYGKPIYNQYGASGFPTFVITDANGNMLTKRSGKINKEEFINWIKPYYK